MYTQHLVKQPAPDPLSSTMFTSGHLGVPRSFPSPVATLPPRQHPHDTSPLVSPHHRPLDASSHLVALVPSSLMSDLRPNLRRTAITTVKAISGSTDGIITGASR
jgi:hypothetical protein